MILNCKYNPLKLFLSIILHDMSDVNIGCIIGRVKICLRNQNEQFFATKQLIFWVEEESAIEYTTRQNDQQTLCYIFRKDLIYIENF